MADEEKKIIEGEFEFEAVIPDKLFHQGEMKPPEISDEVFAEDYMIQMIHIMDLDSLDNRQVSFSEEDVIKQAEPYYSRWIHQLVPRSKGIQITVEATIITDDEDRVDEAVRAKFITKIPDIVKTPQDFRDMILYQLMAERMSDVGSALESRFDAGVESGEEMGYERGSEDCAEQMNECEEAKKECEDALEPAQLLAGYRQTALDEIGSNAIIIRGLNYGTTEDPQQGSVRIYGPTGELLRKIEGDEILEAWDEFGKGVSQGAIGAIAKIGADLPEGAPREILNKLTLRIRPTSKGPQITQRTGPSAKELKEFAEAELEGLGALVKGVFRARPAGVDVQSLAEERIVEVEKYRERSQTNLIANLGSIKAIFIRGYVEKTVGHKFGDKGRFVDLRPISLDQADEMLHGQKWIKDRFGQASVTIGFQARLIEYSGEITPSYGMFRDHVTEVVWRKHLEDAEKRHNEDLELENRQLGACQRKVKRLKEILKLRMAELRHAGIEPRTIPPGEDLQQPTLPGLEGLEDDPGFPTHGKIPHDLPACVVGDERSCQIEARERMVQYGAAVLSTAELVAIALGIKEAAAREMLEDHGGLIGLFKAPIGSLIRAKGVGPKTGLKVKAVGELSARICSTDETFDRVLVTSPDAIAPFIKHFRLREVESFWIALVDARNRLKGIREVCKGTVDACSLHPRDIFSRAILEGATGVIIIHNHPSGNPKPSSEDLSLTERLRKGASLLGIRLLDHLIVAGNNVVSMRGLGLW